MFRALTFVLALAGLPQLDARAASPSESRTGRVASFSRVPALVQSFGANTLVVDLDDTLLRPRHQVGTQAWFDHRLEELKDTLGDADAARRETQREWYLVQSNSRMCAVERCTAQVLAQMRESLDRVVALTARGPEAIEATLGQLARLGLGMKEEGHRGARIDLGRGAFYQGGVIFTANPANKLYAMETFFKKLGPSRRVVFVDDLPKNVQLLQQLSVPILGLHYTGAARYRKRYDHAVAQEQLRTLLETGRVPSNAAARRALRPPSPR